MIGTRRDGTERSTVMVFQFCQIESGQLAEDREVANFALTCNGAPFNSAKTG
jgi:hypothetical protein